MSGFEVFALIASTISHHHLGERCNQGRQRSIKAFHEVNGRLPLTETALKVAKLHEKHMPADKAQALETLLKR